MQREYYPCWIRLDEQDLFLLWYSNGSDGVVLSDDGQVLAFQTLDDLAKFADSAQIPVSTGELVLHDLDAVGSWVQNGDGADLDCSEALAAWNLLEDFQRSAGQDDTLERGDYQLYMKILTANNLPIFTPPGEAYYPTWSDQELDELRQLLRAPLEEFCRSIRIQ